MSNRLPEDFLTLGEQLARAQAENAIAPDVIVPAELGLVIIPQVVASMNKADEGLLVLVDKGDFSAGEMAARVIQPLASALLKLASLRMAGERVSGTCHVHVVCQPAGDPATTPAKALSFGASVVSMPAPDSSAEPEHN